MKETGTITICMAKARRPRVTALCMKAASKTASDMDMGSLLCLVETLMSVTSIEGIRPARAPEHIRTVCNMLVTW